MRYTALIHKEPDTAYGVSFPDMPGCIAIGDTVDEAMASAVDALALHVRGIEADGERPSPPRTAEAILSDPTLADDLEGAIIASVPLVRDLGSTTRINVSLDLGLLKAMDDEVRLRGQTRSAFIAGAVRKELAE